jgi:UDP-2,4-diacetamido-2,4,6-trideoxy-beta-L-altropyranose hydrolase
MAANSGGALRVLFRVAAGPRIGYGHLVRATVLAQAMGTPAVVSLRGNSDACGTARRLGCRIVVGWAQALLRTIRPDIVLIDDPSRKRAAAWRRAAQSAGVPVASVHDIGIGYCGADLTIDGSVTLPAGTPDGPALLGPRYAILAPRSRSVGRRDRTVLVALGGGPRDSVALALARAIREECPDVAVRVAAGYAPNRVRPTVAGVTWLGPQRGLGGELARASVAVVGGGVTLYEACRDGTPTVALNVVRSQRPTIRAFVIAGAALDGGPASSLAGARRLVARLINDPALRRRMGMTGHALIDGRGAKRVARALRTLARASRRSRRGERT